MARHRTGLPADAVRDRPRDASIPRRPTMSIAWSPPAARRTAGMQNRPSGTGNRPGVTQARRPTKRHTKRPLTTKSHFRVQLAFASTGIPHVTRRPSGHRRPTRQKRRRESGGDALILFPTRPRPARGRVHQATRAETPCPAAAGENRPAAIIRPAAIPFRAKSLQQPEIFVRVHPLGRRALNGGRPPKPRDGCPRATGNGTARIQIASSSRTREPFRRLRTGGSAADQGKEFPP